MIYTLGHSNHPFEHFLALLQRHGITLLVDVRSTPYSRFNPQYNREALQKSLAAAGIQYVFAGEELGARSKDPSCYEDGRVSYRKLASTAAFQRGIDRVLAEAAHHRVALMCAEKEPLECHRTILVARELTRRDGDVAHILADGSLESHADAMRRLRNLLKLPVGDLFSDDEATLEEAYELQGRRIAYALPATDASG